MLLPKIISYSGKDEEIFILTNEGITAPNKMRPYDVKKNQAVRKECDTIIYTIYIYKIT